MNYIGSWRITQKHFRDSGVGCLRKKPAVIVFISCADRMGFVFRAVVMKTCALSSIERTHTFLSILLARSWAGL